MENLKHVAVFIDNSNVFHYIYEIRKVDRDWACLYNPLVLGQKLAGDRKLVYVGFYCVRPPSYLLSGDALEQKNIIQRKSITVKLKKYLRCQSNTAI